jgi:hypothetical protein
MVKTYCCCTMMILMRQMSFHHCRRAFCRK